ncbi:MAG: iron-containing alcohol dehydrogenase family protein [Alphaproteobacteria bacterium]|nr:iron-containing alcohol dehydrogenase family protein [Alphaproteobacteria bacterium]
MRLNQTYINKRIDVPYLLKIGEGKLAKIGKYLSDKEFENVALFLGEGVEALIGDAFFKGLDAFAINVVLKKTATDIDLESIARTAFALPPAVDAIIGIGGGKALDFAKYAAYLLKLPYIAVPTVMSNDGFCSPSSSLTVAGKRKSVKSGVPFGVVIDLDIIRDNPDVFLYSGIGDMVSKITALHDWKNAFRKDGERFNDFAALMAYNSLDILFLKHSFNIRAPEFQRSLANSLLISGVAMEIAGSSRPASGSEHLISHALDTVSVRPKAHGIQVGAATYLCALLQRNENIADVASVLTNTGFLDFVGQSPFDRAEFERALKLAPAIKPDYYTILSESDSFDRAVHYLDTDETLKRIVQ